MSRQLRSPPLIINDVARAIVVTAALAACTTYDDVYAPEQATVQVDGYPAVNIKIPPERPTGEVRVVSFGLVDVQVTDQPQTMRTLHVRLLVDNESDPRPWVVDTRAQLIEIPKLGRSRALFVNANTADVPLVEIPTRMKRTFDLYYPLPAGVTATSDLAGFDVLWQVQTPERPIAQRTSFQRIEPIDEVYGTFDVGTGWWPYWWYDPIYPSPYYYPSQYTLPPQMPQQVIVRPYPRSPYQPVNPR
ncbi:MAG TPA: hypothetical protein VM734_15210 [Kofleriaceae bacterium]|nr:hypothetical protein [Kofleriaceae bacterium]